MGVTESTVGGAASGAGTGAAVGTAITPGIGTAIGAAVGGLVGGVSGYLSGKSRAKSESERLRIEEEMRNYIRSIKNPEEKALVYKQLSDAGEMKPELEQDILQSDTEMRNVSTDPRLKEAQMGALASLQDLGQSGGLDAMDRANVEQARRRAAMESANQQGAVQENMARRGMGGSGLEMVQRQMAGQAAANQANSADLQIQGEARRRALEAIMKGGQLGGDIRGQEFDEKAKAAQAQDLINQFNVKNRIGVQSNNVNALNDAQKFNIGTRQKDITNANEATKYNLEGADRRFDREMAKVGVERGVATNISNIYGDQTKDTEKMYGALTEGLGKIGAAYVGNKKS